MTTGIQAVKYGSNKVKTEFRQQNESDEETKNIKYKNTLAISKKTIHLKMYYCYSTDSSIGKLVTG